MEERTGEAFADQEPLIVIGKRLHQGETAPDFCLDYLDLADLAVRTVVQGWSWEMMSKSRTQKISV